MQNLLVFAKGTNASNAHNKKFAIRGSAQREGRHWGPYYTANTLFENDQKNVSLLRAKPATFIHIFRHFCLIAHTPIFQKGFKM